MAVQAPPPNVVQLTYNYYEATMKRVTGIGGIMFKAKDPKALGAWYKEHLGIDVQPWWRYSQPCFGRS
jgi:hypothetical protein